MLLIPALLCQVLTIYRAMVSHVKVCAAHARSVLTIGSCAQFVSLMRTFAIEGKDKFCKPATRERQERALRFRMMHPQPLDLGVLPAHKQVDGKEIFIADVSVRSPWQSVLSVIQNIG